MSMKAMIMIMITMNTKGGDKWITKNFIKG